jgi:hypothetical protein
MPSDQTLKEQVRALKAIADELHRLNKEFSEDGTMGRIAAALESAGEVEYVPTDADFIKYGG